MEILFEAFCSEKIINGTCWAFGSSNYVQGTFWASPPWWKIQCRKFENNKICKSRNFVNFFLSMEHKILNLRWKLLANSVVPLKGCHKHPLLGIDQQLMKILHNRKYSYNNTRNHNQLRFLTSQCLWCFSSSGADKLSSVFESNSKAQHARDRFDPYIHVGNICQRSIHLSINEIFISHPSICDPPSTYPPIHLYTHLSIHSSTHPFIHPFIHPSIHRSIPSPIHFC